MMSRKIFIILFSSSLLINAVHAKTYTNKTYFSPRPQLTNMAMEFSSWHTQLPSRRSKAAPQDERVSKNKFAGSMSGVKTDRDKKNKFAGSVQATGFYQSSNNKYNLGQYFGYYARFSEKKIRDFISVEDGAVAAPAVPSNIDLDGIDTLLIVHDHDSAGVQPDFGARIQFKPKQEVYGVRIDYHQAVKDFFFQVGLPLVNVANSINPTPIGTPGNLTTGAVLHPNAGKTLADYLRGDFEVIDPTPTTAHFELDQQKALTHAKIGGKQSTGGVADIAVKLGYNILNKKGNRIAFHLDGVIPTGNTADGVYLFEPIYGNGNHWGFGGGVDSKLELWENDHDTIELLINLNLTYLFKSDEKRTLSLIGDDGNKIFFSHYFLGGESGKHILFPLANVLTRDIDVEPGLQFESLLALAFRTGNFTFDVGYNLFAKEGEHISLKHSWPEDRYAVADADYNTNPAELFDPSANFEPVGITDGTILTKHLDLDAVTHPSSMTHKIYTAFGYVFNNWKYPLMLSLGTSYEVVSSGNSALENFAVWSKVGVSF